MDEQLFIELLTCFAEVLRRTPLRTTYSLRGHLVGRQNGDPQIFFPIYVYIKYIDILFSFVYFFDTYTFIYIYIYYHLFICLFVNIYIYMCVYRYIFILIFKCIYVYIYMLIRANSWITHSSPQKT